MNFSKVSFSLIVLLFLIVPLYAQVIEYYDQESEHDEKIIKQKKQYIDSLDLYYFEDYSEEGIIETSYYSTMEDSTVFQGQYVHYDSTGIIRWTKEYTEGKLDGSLKSFWPNGQTKRIDNYENGKWLDGVCYDSSGDVVSYYGFEKMPEFPGGQNALLEVIYKNLKYPKKSRRNGIEGFVVVQFVVDKTGKMTKPKVVRSPDSSLTKATNDVIKKLIRYRWAPGEHDGEKVQVLYTLPVAFRLQ